MTQQETAASPHRRHRITRALDALPLLAVALLAMALPGEPAAAQVRPSPPPASAAGDTVTLVPAPEYDASILRRALLGNGWRSLWTTPVDAQVFDFDRYAGGVSWTERGGGNQSITLHLESEQDWREYIFRSVNKFPEQALPYAFAGTTLGWVVGDLISATLPAAPLLVPPLLDALAMLHVEPVLRVMPDDPRLGVYQDTFAGMLGTVELQPNEGPDDTPGFAGSSKIKGTEEFFNDLEESKAHRLDEREFLAARLLDFMINDTDRTMDNMRWVRYGADDRFRWRPLPVDRDWAFVNADGWVGVIAGNIYPKFVELGPTYPDIHSLTYSSHIIDRRLLQRLTRADFAEVAGLVQRAITDDVIDATIARMPDRWRTTTDAPDRIRRVLEGHRQRLPDIAEDFYEYLATDVDIRGTDEPDLAIIERQPDGRVRVTITWPDEHDRSGEPFFDRTFVPGETGEVRVFLHGDDDEARVVGAGSKAITVRVIGGGGDDRLLDEAGGGATQFYDSRGDNEFRTARGTAVSTRDWDAPVPTEGMRLGGAWAPDWSGGRKWSPTVDYGEVAGLVVGVGPQWKSYEFRRLPYHWTFGARVLYSFGTSSPGIELSGDYRYENSPLALTLAARATGFESFRFNGYGNDTPDAGDAGLIRQDRVIVSPALRWHIGWRDRETAEFLVGAAKMQEVDGEIRPLVGTLDVGPTFLWTDPAADAGSPVALADSFSAGSLSRLGARTALALDRTDRNGLPRRGWRLHAAAAGYPAMGGLPDAFAEGSAEASAFVPLTGDGLHMALRAGGAGAVGAFPVQHSPFVGGRTTLRGYRWQRYRGDAAAFGSAELRAPLAPVELLIRWDTGVFALADAGRVWVDGDSPGGWHTAFGAGLWLDALGNTISASWARGDKDRFYLQMNMGF